MRKIRASKLSQKTRLPKKPRNLARQVTLRLLLVWGLLFLCATGLAVRLYHLQVVDPVIAHEKAPKNKNYKAIARSQQTANLQLFTPRRQIVDRNQNVLATDRINYELYVHPALFIKNAKPVSAEEIAQSLATILKTDSPENLLKKFGRPGPLFRNLPESVVPQIRALQIDGLDLRKNYSRYYPYQDMAAEVIGYINKDSSREPKAGLELTQNNLLERPSITLRLKRSFLQLKGKTQPIFHPGELKRSQKLFQFDDLRLQTTLDLRLQQSAREALKAGMDKYKAKRGAVLVMDVWDGSIPILVCEPTYDPNRYNEYQDYSVFKNWAITDLYEPGSTFKPINVAIALEAGVVTPNAKIEDTGKTVVNTHTIRNHDYREKGARGKISIPQILQYSSNIGMINIMKQLSRPDYYHKLQELGIEEPLKLDIPGYTPGQLRDEVEFSVREIDAATAAFGQGFSLTPMKLLQLHAAIANGGELMKPHLVKGLVDFDGNIHYEIPSQSKKIWDSKITQTVLEMMETVVDQGSGKVSQIPGYRIAGKTGTAQKINQTGAYDETAKITSFVAIFPVENPRYAILAVVDEPKGRWTFGSTVAAPIVKDVIETIIAHEGIAPSREPEKN
ncbi:cell division protein FtsI/penicillin-binding protein 2 [Xenococcus sp. PCC 7305]|uniref:peptidoglycan D,D-transpeptidase FtsI family protein n=1 Tax=Xenococcus sp. PCC 7305 TaxID=102125 RepID=UPI0002ACCA56|nr:penicillin-binding protein 2 [Xenococcus sp. PCC 7305]ELS03650.1 cell division protein FtsI/penicillin-binding protein 2 [Xenococcus sp. PCC 7305]